jgi:AcrR family transcriptional regulator
MDRSLTRPRPRDSVGAIAAQRARATAKSVAGPADVDSRTRILEAALALMAEQGFSGTSISMICRRSGLPPSSTYWHFGSKDGLLAATVEYGAGKWLDSIPRWDSLRGNPEDRLREMLKDAAESLADRPAFLRILILLPLERQEMDKQSLEIIRTVRYRAAAAFRRAFREIFESDGGPTAEAYCRDLAHFALSQIDGAFVAYEIDRDAGQLARDFELLAEAFLALGRLYMDTRPAPGRARPKAR